MAVAELDGKIYVLGGYPSNRVSVTTVQVYDPAADSWTLGPPLPGPVNHTTAASANGKLYLLGGQSSAAGGGPFLDTVYELDPAVGEWVLKAPMPRARGGGAAAVVDGRIYVAGGRPPHGQDFAVYDPAVDSWTILPDVPTGRNHIAAAAMGGKVYVVGGRFGSGFGSDMTNVLEVFDPQTSSWSTAAPMPTVRGGLNAAVINGCLHVFGGEGGSGMFNQHEVYDPVTDSWFSLPPMATAVHGVTGLAVIGEWIHLPGGGTAVGGSSGSTIHQVVRTEIVCS
jgi:N-acetylneuraminic acid mutarotase